VIEEYKKFLYEQNILPLENWKVTSIDHSCEKNNYEQLNKDLKTKKGIYIYFCENKCIYIGEGKLESRFKSHSNASWKPMPKGRNYKQYYFFPLYRRMLTVYYYEIEDEFDRKVVENMLTRIYNPEYINFRKDLK
jgi:hypothetical protein